MTSSPTESPGRSTRPGGSLPLGQRIQEWLIENFLFFCALLSIGITLAIAGIVLYGSVQFFLDPKVSLSYFFTGTEWSAGFDNPKYGILPLLAGTVIVAVIAAVVALPIGLATAVYLSEYASPRVRSIVKPTLEILAGIPTVVYGYFALTTITPFLALFIPGLNEPHNQLAGGIVVGIMILPMVASLSEDAIRAVPRSLREASYALGANRFETSTRVIVPAALSGILASFILALSRAVGETMAVSLACGDKPTLTLDPRQGLATMTSFIVRIAQGDVQHGTTDFNSLFAVAATLFVMTLTMNIVAQWILSRYRQVYQ
jgi:phosphate transport system permease protein